MAQFSSLALIGAAAWLWYWNLAERRVAEAEIVERSATTRRVYVYLTLATSLVAMLVSLAIVIYRVISDVLGVASSGNLISAISLALGVVIVAALLFAYHVVVLRADLAQREAPQKAEAALRLPLTLIVPAGGDVEDVLAELRLHLPEGYALEAGKLRLPRSEPASPGQRLERDHA